MRNGADAPFFMIYLTKYFTMKKLAVGLFGIHYVENLNHWMKWKTTVDYSDRYKNNREFLYNDFESAGNCLDFYSATYFSDNINSLIKDYRFKSLSLENIDNQASSDLSTSFVKRNRIFKKTIKLILDNKSNDYDFVILTRYDMDFKLPIINLNLDYDKINLFYRAKWGDNHNLCDDNFYFMPYSKLQYFYDQISKIDESICGHEYHLYFKPDDLHYIVDGAYFSHESPIYNLKRVSLKSDN
jgi:hypothetical protein